MNIRVEHAVKPAPAWQVWLALATVYLVWGSTYLAIRITVETLPPFLAAGVRFLLAGAVMYLYLRFRHGRRHVRVTPAEIGSSAAIGALLLFAANGVVMVAEQEVSSSLASLIIASVPLWVVLLRALARERISRGALGGVVAGFAGVALLVMPGGSHDVDPVGGGLLIFAAFAWALGSFLSKRLSLPGDPFVSTSVQMLCGGVVLFVAGTIAGEWAAVDVARFSVASVAALAYLVVAGSLIGFTAYTWVLQHAPISKVSTYAYVNPVVAIFLGWLVLSESITSEIMVGAAIILASVAFIVRKEAAPVGTEAQPAPHPVVEPPPEPSDASALAGRSAGR